MIADLSRLRPSDSYSITQDSYLSGYSRADPFLWEIVLTVVWADDRVLRHFGFAFQPRDVGVRSLFGPRVESLIETTRVPSLSAVFAVGLTIRLVYR